MDDLSNLSGVLDPRLQGVLSAAFAGLQAAGPSRMPTSMGQVLGAGGQAGLGAYNTAYQNQVKNAQTQSLIDLEKQKSKLAEIQTRQAERQLGLQEGALSMLGIGVPGALSAPTMGGPSAAPAGALNGAPAASSAAPQAGLNLPSYARNAAAADIAFNGGKGFPKIIEESTGPRNVQGVGMMIPDPANPGGFIFAPGQIEGLTTLERKRAEIANENKVVKRKDPTTGQEYEITGSEQLRLAQPRNALENLPADQRDLILADMKRSGITDADISMKTPYNGLVKGTVGLSPLNATGPSPQREKYLSESATNFAKYEDGLNARVKEGQDLMMRIEESQNALKNFRAGAGADTYMAAAKVAQAMGFNDLADKMAGGDLSAAQEFSKLAVQQAMEQLKQSMGGAGRIAQAEFKVFQANNPNIDTDPRASQKIFDFAKRVYNRDRAEQEFLNNFKRNPGADLSTYNNAWANEAENRGFTPFAGKPAEPSQKPSTLNELPPANQFKGRRIRDTATNKILVSDGLTWKEAK